METGDIYYSKWMLDGGVEATRPIIVISNTTGNELAPTILVAPISPYTSKNLLPSHVKIEAGEGGLVIDSLVKVEQSLKMEKSSLTQKVGSVSPEIKAKLIDSFNDINERK